MRAPNFHMPQFHLPHWRMPHLRAHPGDHRISAGDIRLWALVGLALIGLVGAGYAALNSPSYLAALSDWGPVRMSPW